jgi:hypothetical protein
MKRGLAAGGANRTDATLERGKAFLEHSHRRVGQPGIEMTGDLKVEKASGVVTVIEDV